MMEKSAEVSGNVSCRIVVGSFLPALREPVQSNTSVPGDIAVCLSTPHTVQEGTQRELRRSAELWEGGGGSEILNGVFPNHHYLTLYTTVRHTSQCE